MNHDLHNLDDIQKEEVKQSLEYKVHLIPDEYIDAWRNKELKWLEERLAENSMILAGLKGSNSFDQIKVMLQHLKTYIEYRLEYVEGKEDRDLFL